MFYKIILYIMYIYKQKMSEVYKQFLLKLCFIWCSQNMNLFFLFFFFINENIPGT